MGVIVLYKDTVNALHGIFLFMKGFHEKTARVFEYLWFDQNNAGK
jgi:hypothetical protein